MQSKPNKVLPFGARGSGNYASPCMWWSEITSVTDGQTDGRTTYDSNNARQTSSILGNIWQEWAEEVVTAGWAYHHVWRNPDRTWLFEQGATRAIRRWRLTLARVVLTVPACLTPYGPTDGRTFRRWLDHAKNAERGKVFLTLARLCSSPNW